LPGQDFPHEVKAGLTGCAVKIDGVTVYDRPAIIHRHCRLGFDAAIFGGDVLLGRNHFNVGDSFNKLCFTGIKRPGDYNFLARDKSFLSRSLTHAAFILLFYLETPRTATKWDELNLNRPRRA